MIMPILAMVTATESIRDMASNIFCTVYSPEKQFNWGVECTTLMGVIPPI
jgi:hypothetical protein